MANPLTRRDFLNLVGAAGGSAAVFQVTTALGITPVIENVLAPKLTPLNGKQCKVVLLGAGISALTSAYELSKAGYQCTILEASHRAGGRNLTLRHGDFIDEVGNPQQCQFDDAPHLYMNAGAARIPHTHKKILAYCKELGVELEIFENEKNLIHELLVSPGWPCMIFRDREIFHHREIFSDNQQKTKLEISFWKLVCEPFIVAFTTIRAL